jgi:hypothetical protein
MAALDPEVASLAAQIAAAERWGRVPDRAEATQPARAGLRAKFEREADPDGTLDPAERARRADHLQRAHMLRMSLAAKRARARRTAVTVNLPDGGGPRAA